MWYVYILICSDKKHMKIGVSGKDLSRIIRHHKTYNILINSSRFIPLTERRLALKVESYLLRNIPGLRDEVRTEDGSTELRDVRWAKDIKEILQTIKKNPEFSYVDVKRMCYKLYNINELILKFGEYSIIDTDKVKKQYESLTTPSTGGVKKKKWKRIEISGKGWHKSTVVECLD